MTVNGIGQRDSLPRQAEKMDSSRLNDAESKGIQNRITDAQQQLQRLSSDKELTADEKKQKRQEVQKEIADLNRELRQRQMELRRKQLEEQDNEKKTGKTDRENNTENIEKSSNATKGSGTEEKDAADTKGPEAKRKEEEEEKQQDVSSQKDKDEKKQQDVFPKKSDVAMLAANTTKNQAETQRQVAVSLKGNARIIQGEIDQDTRRGQNTQRKEEALKATEERAARASSAQMGLLSRAAQDIRQFNLPGSQTANSGKDKNAEQKPASIVGAPQNDYTQNAIQRYNAGKMYSSVTFHV